MSHLPHEVFALSGMVEGEITVRGGYAVAPTPEAVIEGFRQLGFRVVSVSSMADIATSIEALDALRERSPAIPETDYLNLLAPAVERGDTVVFTFTGTQDPSVDQVYAGFAVAPDRRYLTDYLSSLGFTTYSVVSLSDLRSVYADLQRFAAGDEDESLVSFKP